MQPLILAGEARTTRDAIGVVDKYNGAELGEVARAQSEHFDAALDAATAARPALARMTPDERAGALLRVERALAARKDDLAQCLVEEGGKPIQAARGEVERMLATFRISAHEALRPREEAVPLADGASGQADGYRAIAKRVPIGVAGFITPFNFPVNLVAHKVAPAIAAGCPFVVKPASTTPRSALALGEVLLEHAGLPDGAFSILPARGADAEVLATDPRVAKVSFTGSDEVGWRLAGAASRAKVTLELGGNAAVLVDETADLDDAADRIAKGAFGQAGQSCISVQRIVCVEAVYDDLRERLIERTRATVAGDPRDEATVVGPLISVEDGERVLRWVAEAVDAGATLLAGGERDGAVVQATLLEGAPRGARVLDDEVFGPVATLQRVRDFDAALEEANRTRFGLQAGVFTRDRGRAMQAWDRLEVGGVIVGDVPTWRADAMPYGGVKDSGLGREGPRYAIEAMTELRLLVMRD